MQLILRIIPAAVEVLLYANDILLVVRGPKNEGLHRKLQVAVKAVDKWAKSVGFGNLRRSYKVYIVAQMCTESQLKKSIEESH